VTEFEDKTEKAPCGHTHKEHMLLAAEKGEEIAAMMQLPDNIPTVQFGVVSMIEALGGGQINSLGVSLTGQVIQAAFERQSDVVFESAPKEQVYDFAADLLVEAVMVGVRDTLVGNTTQFPED
jgi:hypothetical protein